MDEPIFPLVRVDDASGRFEILGTGFFVATGIFLTAKHVVVDDSGVPRGGLLGLHSAPNNRYFIRHLLSISCHPSADIGVGVLREMRDKQTGQVLTNRCVSLCRTVPAMHSPIGTYAFPLGDSTDGLDKGLSFEAGLFAGSLLESYAGRSSAGPCHVTSNPVYGGASGGPVFGANKLAFAINAGGYKLPHAEVPFGSVVPINLALDLPLTALKIAAADDAIVTLARLGELGFARIQQTN